ncbi:60S ribosomal protein L43 [Chytriomyces hyalinus]|nr:60S ribosomal protein L43 [Chytriomyces hyalinus]
MRRMARTMTMGRSRPQPTDDQRTELTAQERVQLARDAALSHAANCAVSHINPSAAPAAQPAFAPHSHAGSDAPRAADSGVASIEGGRVLLGEKTIEKFKDRVNRKVEALATIPPGSGEEAQSYKVGVFVTAGRRFLQQTAAIKASLLVDLETSVLTLIGNFCDQEAGKVCKERGFTLDQRDVLFLAAVELFVATLKEVIQGEPNTGSAVCRHKIFSGTADSLRPFLTRYLKNNAAISGDKADGSLLEWLRVISNYSNDDFLRVSRNAKAVATKDLAFFAMTEYQKELEKTVTRGYDLETAPFEDFKSPDDCLNFVRGEVKTINQWISLFKLFYPNLKTDHQFPPDAISILIPKDRAQYYREILSLCVLHDFKADRENSMDLSKTSIALLSELAFRWRLTKNWRELVHMEVLLQLYSENVLSISAIMPKLTEFMDTVNKRYETSRISEDKFYFANLNRAKIYIEADLNAFPDFMGDPDGNRDAVNQRMQALTVLFEKINTDVVFCARGNPIPDLYDYVESLIQQVAIHRFGDWEQQSKINDSENSLEGLLKLTKLVSQDIDKFHRYFPDKVYGRLVIGDQVERIYMNNGYFVHMSNLQYEYEKNKDKMDLVLGEHGLYSEVSDLYSKLDRSVIGNVDVEEFFRPFIVQWLDRQKNDWAEWSKNTIAKDNFVPTSAPLNMSSSSVNDLFKFFYNGLNFMKKLKEDAANARRREELLIQFLKLMGKSLIAFAEELFREFETLSKISDGQKVVFSRQQYVKLNNVVAAMTYLEKVFKELDIKLNERRINNNAQRIEPDPNFVNVVVTIVRAFDLPIVDTISSDPFVRLLHGGNDIGCTTKVIHKNLNPVWNESWNLQIPIQNSRDAFDFEVLDEDAFTTKFCAKSRIQEGISFNDRIYQDFLTHEDTLTLEPKGRLVVRVARVGEIHDREFWVQKSLETLKFTAERMIRVFTDSIVRYSEVEWNKISQSFKLSMSVFSSKQAAPIVDADVEKLLLPLLKYLDESLSLMNESVDRPLLDSYLKELYPFLFDGGGGMNGGSGAVDDEQSVLDKPSVLALVVWYELLVRLSSSVSAIQAASKRRTTSTNAAGADTSNDALTESDKRQIRVLELVLEFLKAFFYCDLDGRCCGFPMKAKRTKKVGVTGKYGTRYGASLRKQVKKFEVSQHAKYTCTFCGKDAVKRTAVGIWKCKGCKKTMAGGAWTVGTTAAATVRGTVRRLRELTEA